MRKPRCHRRIEFFFMEKKLAEGQDGKSEMKIRKSRGASIEPCGTPAAIEWFEEKVFSSLTLNDLFIR